MVKPLKREKSVNKEHFNASNDLCKTIEGSVSIHPMLENDNKHIAKPWLMDQVVTIWKEELKVHANTVLTVQ